MAAFFDGFQRILYLSKDPFLLIQGAGCFVNRSDRQEILVVGFVSVIDAPACGFQVVGQFGRHLRVHTFRAPSLGH